jgi:hypothetical protein
MKFAMENISIQSISRKIHVIRGQRVMLDSDLAELYEVETFNLNKAVKRNIERFPADFMFQLTNQEFKNLIFQFGISSSAHGGRRKLPYVFTQEGVAMLSGVLKSARAIKVNIEIMRTFVELREIVNTDRDLAKKLIRLEGKYDDQFKVVFDAIRQLMHPSSPTPKRRIGF